jgi:hypothetical protein
MNRVQRITPWCCTTCDDCSRRHLQVRLAFRSIAVARKSRGAEGGRCCTGSRLTFSIFSSFPGSCASRGNEGLNEDGIAGRKSQIPNPKSQTNPKGRQCSNDRNRGGPWKREHFQLLPSNSSLLTPTSSPAGLRTLVAGNSLIQHTILLYTFQPRFWASRAPSCGEPGGRPKSRMDICTLSCLG